MRTEQSWLNLMADSCLSFPRGPTRTMVVDPVTLALVGANHADASDSDAREIAAKVLDGHHDQINHALHAGEDFGWATNIATPTDLLEGAGALLFNPTLDEAALLLTASPAGQPEPETFEPVAVSASTMVHTVYDARLRSVFVDPRLGAVGLDPGVYLDRHPWPTTHPCDAARANSLVRKVMLGNAIEAEFSARSAGPLGRWYNHHVTLRPFRGHDTGYLAVYRALGATRETIPTESLTSRELELTADFYSGLRIASIARRYDVSEKTVRNQLSSVYNKLEVGSSDDMLLRYDPPDRLVYRQLGVRLIPLQTVRATPRYGATSAAIGQRHVIVSMPETVQLQTNQSRAVETTRDCHSWYPS